eukprot:1847223-Rhodomonas_salina.1
MTDLVMRGSAGPLKRPCVAAACPSTAALSVWPGGGGRRGGGKEEKREGGRRRGRREGGRRGGGADGGNRGRREEGRREREGGGREERGGPTQTDLAPISMRVSADLQRVPGGRCTLLVRARREKRTQHTRGQRRMPHGRTQLVKPAVMDRGCGVLSQWCVV